MLSDANQSRIVVQHLDERMSEKEIKDTFCKYGSIIDIDIATTKGGFRKDKIFIQYARKESAQLAIRSLHGKRFGDKILVVTQFEESEFQRVRKNLLYEEQDDIIGREEGLEPPAYVKYPRRSQMSSDPNAIHVPRPKTPQDPPQITIPKPPPIELYRPPQEQILPPQDPKDTHKASSETTRDPTPHSSHHKSSEQRHERHNHHRDRDERRRYEDSRYYEEKERSRKSRDDNSERESRKHRDHKRHRTGI
ncbi:hypothetical protein TVAG_107420 [Trichomonas vaginalis G3]|uniref:RRM domain-containing protein n=1 Tax=Trichomonas vaginalis (strain ATCC PRA-98 / G3) TaxID=412133 RepID=A2FSC1_TRIV3|nr:RNA binding [Trichomonas vaginalis G3]EAX92208.1 hypothetical protein TVAG_107420 [Trichomonas vaginalis G3]KAI5543992.1 RNA binding [Trichomonas vaginalis G3]|eukprot:XP_001305138.1 hypothetical protein [Trichomonas vaginalis G3]